MDQNQTIRYGHWTALGDFVRTARGERKLHCRCDCGTERFVLERALKSGGSQSCGCLRREKAAEAVAYDLTGRTFGQLRVLKKADDQSRSGGVWWQCECGCGSTYEAPATLLVTGKRTHCGGEAHRKNYAFADITGQRFSRLTALWPLETRDSKGSVVWRCRCNCGNEVDVSYNCLMYSEVKSCGCRKKEHDQNLGKFLTHVDGTSIDMLKSRKLPANNTTGVKGVYLIRGKYVAKIVFQKKQYFLGAFERLEEAAEARKEAEEQINGSVLAHFEKWNARAVRDPQWARDNPVRFEADRDQQGRLRIRCYPALEEPSAPAERKIYRTRTAVAAAEHPEL